MRTPAHLVIVLQPWNGHRVGAVVGVEEPLRARLIALGVLRGIERPAAVVAVPEVTPEPVADSPTPTRKPMKKQHGS
jgi:hypothetical protein